MTDQGPQRDACGPFLNAGFVHASAVAIEGRALLILGKSGAGKSSLALELLAKGAELIGDDRVELVDFAGAPHLRAHPRQRGHIEARGIGILSAPHRVSAPLGAVVDLDLDETERLPPRRYVRVLGREVTLFRRTPAPYMGAALWIFMTHGWGDVDAG